MPSSASLISTPEGISAVGPATKGKGGLVVSWATGEVFFSFTYGQLVQLEGDNFPAPSKSFEFKHTAEFDAVAGTHLNGKLAVAVWNHTVEFAYSIGTWSRSWRLIKIAAPL